MARQQSRQLETLLCVHVCGVCIMCGMWDVCVCCGVWCVYCMWYVVCVLVWFGFLTCTRSSF